MFVALRASAWFRVGDDASCHGACYLANSDLHFRGCLYHHQRAFVLGAGFGQPCALMASVLMFGHEHGALDRIPVGMHIEWRHEDAHLQALLVKILMLLGGFHHYDSAVRRRDEQIIIAHLHNTRWIAEEVGHKHQQTGTQQ